jgi:hypothetical protein
MANKIVFSTSGVGVIGCPHGKIIRTQSLYFTKTNSGCITSLKMKQVSIKLIGENTG